MLAQLAEAAIRSFALGVVAWLGVTVLCVRNPQIRMTIWTVVLAVSLVMPALTPWMKVTIPRHSSPLRAEKTAWIDISELPPIILSTPAASLETRAAQELPPASSRAMRALGPDWRLVAATIYLFAGGILLLRLGVGLVLMRRVVHKAYRLKLPWAAAADVRVSNNIALPVTFGSTILLPSGYKTWSKQKLQAVLWHEGSHVAHRDFYVLLLAAIHRAVFWFNPFAWWLCGHLASLAEMISDDAAIEGLGDRRNYADILLDIAKTARPLASGLAMARSATVPWRIERILATAAAPVHIGRRQRVLTVAMLVPVSALSAVTIVQKAPPRAANVTAHVSSTPNGSGLTQLDRYAGQYEAGTVSVLSITRHREQLFAQLTGQPELHLFPSASHEFTDEFGDVNVTFVLGGDGPAAEVLLRERNSGLRRATRIDAAIARGIEASFKRRTAAAPDRFRDQIAMPGGEAALRQIIEDLRRGDLDVGSMSPRLAGKLRKQLSYLHKSLTLFGAVESLAFRGVGPGGYDIYSVTFAKGSAEFRIDLTAGGTLEDIAFRPNGDTTQGGAVSCELESTLRSSHDTVPIRLSLTNRSGAAIHLFWLNPAGRRVPHGTLEDSASMYVGASIAQPWVITDLSGQCREILLPGQQTRFHIAGPLQPDGSPTLPAPKRISPFPGSGEALGRYIEGLRQGNPSYARMTPDVAAATRQFLSRRQTILSALGTLEAMPFQGVSESGNDIYRVRFANGPAEWQIGLLGDGRIASIQLGPQF
jgi:hypothetical protein